MRKLLFVWSLLICGFYVGAQNIVKAEYFIDADNGLGLNTEIPIITGEAIDLAFDLPLVGVSAGYHMLHVRVQDEHGKWSLYANTSFLKLPDVLPSGQISEAEYFFDNDPGYGNGTTIPVTGSESEVVLIFDVDFSSLPEGLHVLNARVKNSNNFWSMTDLSFIQVVPNADDFKISRLDYHFEGDDGFVSSIFSQLVDPAAFAVEIDYDAVASELTYNTDYTLVVEPVNAVGLRGLRQEVAFTFAQTEILSFNIEKEDESCSGQTDGRITVDATGGNGEITYSLDGFNYQTQNVFANLTPGDYIVYVKPAFGEVKTESVTIVSTYELPETAAIIESINGENQIVLNSSVDANNQWLLDGAVLVGASGTSLIPKLSGVYQVRVTNENGCSSLSGPFTFGGVSTAERFNFNQRVDASDRSNFDGFGFSVANHGAYAAVGAMYITSSNN